MLLLRSFFRPALPARELAMSTVMFSFSILFRTGDWPVDLRGRRVAGNVVSARPAILVVVRSRFRAVHTVWPVFVVFLVVVFWYS